MSHRNCLDVPLDLQTALSETVHGAPLTWRHVAMIYIRGSIAEFWSNSSEDTKYTPAEYRTRFLGFIRQGYSNVEAHRRAKGG